MNDMKVYGNSTESLHLLRNTTQSFSNDILMKLGIDKCKTYTVINGEIALKSFTIQSGGTIQLLGPHNLYKYLIFQ